MSIHYRAICFCFQAEDGIRDYKVTGVQTCALPISPVREDFPGVEVHANLISGFLGQAIMQRPDLVLAISVLTVLLRSEERRVGKAGAPRSTLSNGNVVGRRDVMATKR